MLGFDAFGAGIELHGQLGMALLLGAVWGAGAGAAGALLAYASGAAGRRVAPLALGDVGAPAPVGPQGGAPQRTGVAADGEAEARGTVRAEHAVPAANPDTNPYLRVPEELRAAEGRRAPEDGPAPEDRRPAEGAAPADRDVRRPEGAAPSQGAGRPTTCTARPL